MVLLYFLPLVPIAEIETLMLLPEKAINGFDPVKFKVSFSKLSAAVAHAISLLLPKVYSLRTEPKIG
ncbi:unannotated protein [freshwater metagenome]|uniref:Unannotated protein n=1 Tax=freshwater metagenome TaxID=449393 RepID=A0A6J6GZM5_9ZZZZ